MIDIEELETLIQMINTTTYRDVERYDSERERLLSRAQDLAAIVGEFWLPTLKQGYPRADVIQTLEGCMEYFKNQSPIYPGGGQAQEIEELLNELKGEI